MDYQHIKPYVLRVIAETSTGECSVSDLVDQIHASLPEEKKLTALRSKIGWAVLELKNEGTIIQTARETVKFASRIAKRKNLVSAFKSDTLTARLFEEECKRVLCHFKFVKVRLTGKTCDRGIDGEATFCICKELTLKFAIQCKGGRKKVSSPQVREFIGSIVGVYAGGIIFSSAGFTHEALASVKKLRQPPVYLVGKEIIGRYYTNKYIFRHE